MKNVLKIVFLGVIGFALLVYLTAPKNMDQSTQLDDSNSAVTIDSIPRYFELIGKSPYTKFETLFQEGTEKYIVVLNHDSLAVFKDLYKKIDKENPFNERFISVK